MQQQKKTLKKKEKERKKESPGKIEGHCFFIKLIVPGHFTSKSINPEHKRIMNNMVNGWAVVRIGIVHDKRLAALSRLGYSIEPIHKGLSLFLLYTNMNTMNSLHHVKEHPKISHFLQFESHSSKSFKVRIKRFVWK